MYITTICIYILVVNIYVYILLLHIYVFEIYNFLHTWVNVNKTNCQPENIN